MTSIAPYVRVFASSSSRGNMVFALEPHCLLTQITNPRARATKIATMIVSADSSNIFHPHAHDEPENSTEDRQTTPLGGESGRND